MQANAFKLLITDDAMIIRQIIKDVAAKVGWQVVGEACNGQDAIDKYLALRPDGVTMDLVMPQYDGLHALRGIMGIDPAARVLVASALEQKDVLKEAFKLGAFDFVVKPFNRELLATALQKLMPQQSAVAKA